MGKQWKQCQTLFFWAPKSLQMVIAAMKFKSRDITLPTKAMVFLVVMYGCECWTVKKAEHQRTDAFELLEKTLESPLDSKEIQPVHPKGSQTLWPPDGKN